MQPAPCLCHYTPVLSAHDNPALGQPHSCATLCIVLSPAAPHLLLLPQPDQLQHEHVLVTLERIKLISHAAIVAQLQW